MKKLIIDDTVCVLLNIIYSHVLRYSQKDVRGKFGSAQIAPSTHNDMADVVDKMILTIATYLLVKLLLLPKGHLFSSSDINRVVMMKVQI